MARKPVMEKVINGRMCHIYKNRSTVDVWVYAGPEAVGEPISEWEMPTIIDYTGIAQIAEAQTPKE